MNKEQKDRAFRYVRLAAEAGREENVQRLDAYLESATQWYSGEELDEVQKDMRDEYDRQVRATNDAKILAAR